jgi:hypothetical protein
MFSNLRFVVSWTLDTGLTELSGSLGVLAVVASEIKAERLQLKIFITR